MWSQGDTFNVVQQRRNGAARGIYLAPGVQHINDPGYNRDRGPVVVPTFRAHVEF
jgi:carbohydrate-selective porin OprB